MPVHPIRSEADHDRALTRIAALMAAHLTAERAGELDALITLADAYEARHSPVPPPTPVAVLEFVLDQNGLSRKDLEPMIGTRARVSEVLSGKRPLTLAMVRRLHAAFGVSADLLIGDEPVPASRAVKAIRKKRRSASMARNTTPAQAGTHRRAT